MGEIKVQVTTNKIKALQVGTKNIKTPIQIEENPTHYYSTLAKQWAILMGKKVQNEDYSSKYWANESKSNALVSQASAETAQNLSTKLNENYYNYYDNLQTLTNTGIEAIENISTGIVEEIRITKDNAITDIDNKENEVIENIEVIKKMY